jgi:histidinol-phosphate aminotransferase
MAVRQRKVLDEIVSYKPAKSLESVRRELGLSEIIKLAGNENNHGCSPYVTKALTEFFGELTLYPDMYGTQLREELAARLGVKENELVFGNGSFELLSLVAQAFLEEGREAVIPAPSFGWYRNATVTSGATPVTVPLGDDYAVDLNKVFEKVNDRTAVVWLCNPNNPTGAYFTAKQLANFLRVLPSSVLVVLDEAYIDFVYGEDPPRATELIYEYPNVISLRTFSKVYGLASLRIGYGIADASVIDSLERVRLPINTNAAAQTAALAALRDDEHYRYVVEANAAGRELYYKTLEKWDVAYIPTQCNFIMLDTGRDSAETVNEYLKNGIMLRGGAEFGMPTWLRITIGTERENKKVLDILGKILGKNT